MGAAPGSPGILAPHLFRGAISSLGGSRRTESDHTAQRTQARNGPARPAPAAPAPGLSYPPTGVAARIHFPRARRHAHLTITPGAAWVRATRRHDVARLPGPVTARTGSGNRRRKRRRARERPSGIRRTELRVHGSAPRSSARGEIPERAAGQNRHEALRHGRPSA